MRRRRGKRSPRIARRALCSLALAVVVAAGPESMSDGDCVYHPGQPVFHEGYKYWSCCPGTKTTEFSDFMSFPGCKRVRSALAHSPLQPVASPSR